MFYGLQPTPNNVTSDYSTDRKPIYRIRRQNQWLNVAEEKSTLIITLYGSLTAIRPMLERAKPNWIIPRSHPIRRRNQMIFGQHCRTPDTVGRGHEQIRRITEHS